MEPQKQENSGIFIPLCETLERAKMKQILKVHFEKELTPTVVLNTFGHLELKQAQDESVNLTISSSSSPDFSG